MCRRGEEVHQEMDYWGQLCLKLRLDLKYCFVIAVLSVFETKSRLDVGLSLAF